MSRSQILVVASDHSSQAELASALEGVGYTVSFVETAREAIFELAEDSYECVVCAESPLDMSVFQIKEIITERHPSLPIFVIGDLQSVEEAESGGTSIEYVPNETALVSAIQSATTSNRLDDILERQQALSKTIIKTTRDMVEANSTEEVTNIVYDRMSSLELYQFVWMGKFDPTDGRVNIEYPRRTSVRASQFTELVGAEDAAYLDRALEEKKVMTTKGSVKTRSSAATANTGETDSISPSGLNSSRSVVNVAVPVIGKDQVHTLILLGISDKHWGGEIFERELLGIFGRIVGHALDTIQDSDEMDVEEFASIVTHELRNPLSLAIMSIDQAQEEIENEWLERVDYAITQIEHILVDELSLLRGKDKGEETVRDLAEDAKEAWRQLDTSDNRLVINGKPLVRGSHPLIVRMFVNLFDNAVTHGGDEVSVRVGALENGFFVEDDGVGLSSTESDRIFDLGYTDAGGTGFGLAVVKRIADAHDWTVEVKESQQGGLRIEFSGVEFGKNDLELAT